jgi:hypothetical protein
LNEVRFYFYLLYAFVLSFCDYWVTVHQCNCGGNYRLQKMQTYQVIWVQTRKNSKKKLFWHVCLCCNYFCWHMSSWIFTTIFSIIFMLSSMY